MSKHLSLESEREDCSAHGCLNEQDYQVHEHFVCLSVPLLVELPFNLLCLGMRS